MFSSTHFALVQVSPDEPKMEWKDLTDRAANVVFFQELLKGTKMYYILCMVTVNKTIYDVCCPGNKYNCSSTQQELRIS